MRQRNEVEKSKETQTHMVHIPLTSASQWEDWIEVGPLQDIDFRKVVSEFF